ncbi:zinc-finger-containing protein [Ferrovum sp.]|uniref:zinc-finger-containing protein n=1 Tax=Ferrovum sp. TaxID=2609467 RepID=UPI00261CB13B|nr:zinc-finger-containing protein [Ferrovum sp.]
MEEAREKISSVGGAVVAKIGSMVSNDQDAHPHVDHGERLIDMNAFNLANPIQPVECPYCDNQAELVQGKEIYPYPGSPQNGMYWLCRPCKAWVGTHKNSPRFAPKGSLANAELRRARQEAHAAFDVIWTENLMSRAEAYAWLARELGVQVKRCHIGFFDVVQCVEAKRLSVQLFDDLIADHGYPVAVGQQQAIQKQIEARA